MLCLNESASYAVSPAPVQCRILILPATGFANAHGKAGRAQNRVIPSKINQWRQKKSFFNSFILTAMFFLHSWEVLIESIKNTKQTQNKLKWELLKVLQRMLLELKTIWLSVTIWGWRVHQGRNNIITALRYSHCTPVSATTYILSILIACSSSHREWLLI